MNGHSSHLLRLNYGCKIECLHKIIVEESNEDPIIEKDLEVKITETIGEEIKEESFKNLNEIKSYDCQSQDPYILVHYNKMYFWRQNFCHKKSNFLLPMTFNNKICSLVTKLVSLLIPCC